MVDNTNSRRTVDLYVSTAVTTVWDGQQAVIDRLEEFESQGRIDHYRLQVWSRRVSLSGSMSDTKFHRAAAKNAEQMERWAEDESATVELPFERETVDSELTGEEYHVLRLPTTCLAVYEDDELAGVYPCEIDGVTCTVRDFLARLAEHEGDVDELKPTVEAVR